MTTGRENSARNPELTHRNRQFSETSYKSDKSYLSQETQLTNISDDSNDSTDAVPVRCETLDGNFSLMSEGSSASTVRPAFDLGTDDDADLATHLIQTYDDKRSAMLPSNTRLPRQSAFDSGDTSGSSRGDDTRGYIHACGSNASMSATPQRPIKSTSSRHGLDSSNGRRIAARYDNSSGSNVVAQWKQQPGVRFGANGRTPRRCSDTSSDHSYTKIDLNSMAYLQQRCLQHSDIEVDGYECCANCRNLQENTHPPIRPSQTWPKVLVEYPDECLDDIEENTELVGRLPTRVKGVLPKINETDRQIDPTNFAHSGRQLPGSSYTSLLPASISGLETPVSEITNRTEHTDCPCRKYIKDMKSSRRLIISLVLFNIALIICAVVLILFTFVSSQVNQNCCDQYPPEVAPKASAEHATLGATLGTCVKRAFVESNFKLKPGAIKETVGLDISTDGDYCFENVAQILRLFDKVLEKKEHELQNTMSGKQSSMLRPVIQVRGIRGGEPAAKMMTERHASSRGNYKLKWAKPHNSIQRSGAALSEDGYKLTVSRSGYYFVYSRVNFRFPSQPRTPVSISHWLIKEHAYSDKTEEVDGVHQSCWMIGQNIEHTSVLETVVYLEYASSVYVTVKGDDNRADLEHNAKKHMFGLFYV